MSIRNVLVSLFGFIVLFQQVKAEQKPYYLLWQTENLSVKTFRNGDPIRLVLNKNEWDRACKSKEPACCYYEFDKTTVGDFGLLYNYQAVNDPRGLAPEGWMIPTISMIRYQIELLEGMENFGIEFLAQINKADGRKVKGNRSLNYDGFFKGYGKYLWLLKGETMHLNDSGIVTICNYSGWGTGMQVRCVKITDKPMVAPNSMTSKKEVVVNGMVFMKRNLQTTTFQNGEKIAFAESAEEWVRLNALNIPVYCYMDFDSLNRYDHGYYYNHEAITDSRGLAPKGWRILTKEDIEKIRETFIDTSSFVKAIISPKYFGYAENSTGLDFQPESSINMYGVSTGVNLIWCPSSSSGSYTVFYHKRHLNNDEYSFWEEDARAAAPVRCVKLK